MPRAVEGDHNTGLTLAVRPVLRRFTQSAAPRPTMTRATPASVAARAGIARGFGSADRDRGRDQGMRTWRVMCPLLSQKVTLLARKGSFGAGCMLPSVSKARDVTRCSPASGIPQLNVQNCQARPRERRPCATGPKSLAGSTVRRRYEPARPRSARPMPRQERRSGCPDGRPSPEPT